MTQSPSQPQPGETQSSFGPQHCELERSPGKLQTYVQMLEDALGCQARVGGILEIGSYAKGEAVPSSDIDTRILVTSPTVYLFNTFGGLDQPHYEAFIEERGSLPRRDYVWSDFNDPVCAEISERLSCSIEFGFVDLRYAEFELDRLDRYFSVEHAMLLQSNVLYDPLGVLERRRSELWGKVYEPLVRGYRERYLDQPYHRVYDGLGPNLWDDYKLNRSQIVWVNRAVRCLRNAVAAKVYAETGILFEQVEVRRKPMKVSCLQENLSRGLSVTRRAVAARPALPALSHVLLATDRSQLKLMATDLELSIVCWIGASVTSEGSVAVPARLLTDLIDSWPAERVDIVLEQGTLHLSCGASQAAIKGIDVQQFPLISSSPDDVQVRIAPRLLREIISQVIFAAATEESRPILTGVLVRFDDDLLTMVAGDGFRLSIRQERFPQAFDNPIEIIIPARALNELVRIIGDEEEPIGIHINPTRSQVLFQLQGSARAREGRIFSIELTSQLIEGRHIDYHRVLPRSHTTRTILDTERLLKACKTASIFARNETNDVCLTVVPGDGVGTGLVRVTAISTDIGDSADELRASVEGEPITIGFDVRYLMDALSVMNSGQVVLETTGLTTPAVIRPLGSDDFVHVLAPMVTHRLR